MKMMDYINDFSNHLKEALNIADKTVLQKNGKEFTNVLIIGLGGSGIGGTIVKDIIAPDCSVPVLSTKNYDLPDFVSDKTLVIVSSYSGNTEETISALKKCIVKGCEIAIITSGGELKSIAKKQNYNHIVIPGGNPPRAMFGYSFTVLFKLLKHYNIIDCDWQKDFNDAICLLEKEQKQIKKEANNLADKLHGKTPVIYAADGFEGVAVRFRQQINENSKVLAWHHTIPEMNHNELLGWRTNTHNLGVIFLRNNCDLQKNQLRIDISKQVISEYTNNISEVWSKGNSIIQNSLYLINFGDWVSWFLSVLNNVDAIEIDVINYLKSELSKEK